jgi:hypothetical protein
MFSARMRDPNAMTGRRRLAARRLGPWGLLGLVALPLACEDEAEDPPLPPAPVLLTDVQQWVRVADVDADVFGAERPADLVCDETLGLALEDLGPDIVFEIKTDACNYATVQQPLLAPVLAGEVISLRMWHWALVAPDPTQGHLALAVDGEVVWEEFVDIPSDAAMIDADFELSRDVAAGADLQLHVHNHGVNAYDFIDLKVTPSADASE